jgi:hypothetical protein
MRKAAPALAIVLCFAAGWAKAEDVCATLETRLAALDRLDRAAWEGSGNADEAVAQKRRELDQATAEARRAGCIGGIFARLHSAGRCAALNARIDRLTAALDRLAAERRALGADPYAAERERSAVIQAMSAQGCRGGEAQDVRRERRANRLFATLFGGTRPFRSGRWDDEMSLPFDLSFGTYRTLCVRTCDGYYFPISFAASGAALYRDAAACRALCPGAEVALYVHRSPGEDAARMVSLAGEPYTALPAAFRYRREYDPSCRCGALTATASIVIYGGDQPGPHWEGSPVPAMPPAPATEDAPLVPRPTIRPSGLSDPDTAANRIGGFIAGDAQDRAPPTGYVYEQGPDGRLIRLVGPPPFLGE